MPCRITCAAFRAEAAAFKYSWPEPEAPLQPTQSKAAATAYKIASSPAVAAAPAAATAAGSSGHCDAILEEVETAAGGAEDTFAPAGNGPGANLLHELCVICSYRRETLARRHTPDHPLIIHVYDSRRWSLSCGEVRLLVVRSAPRQAWKPELILLKSPYLC